VGLHPLAGGERNGWVAADARLFESRVMVYCPSGRRQDGLAKNLIALLGARAVPMEASAHDAFAAVTIGLPHLIAFAAASLRPPATAPHPLRGTSWGSLTRVSVSDPAFVAGLLHSNSRNQLRLTRMFRARLDALCRLLGKPTPDPLIRALRRATTAK
jgi:prephenate dehydrogenase